MGMANSSSTSPGYSQTPRPGYSPNPSTSDYGLTNHQNWLDTVVSYLTSKWAHGDHNLPLGWNSQQFGMPDPANTSATGTGQLPEVTPATYLAFAKYAQAYKPGMDPALDQVIPYIPPGPQDYIEDPAQVTARVANDHWTAEFGQTKTTADRAAWQQDFANQLSAYGYAQRNNEDANSFANSIFGQASANVGNSNSLAGSIYSTQSGNVTNANNLAGNIFNTQSGTYNSNEGNKLGALQSAGGLANSLQQLWDQRTGKAIDLKANPQDLVAREYATRALQGPQADMIPGYSNVSQYQDIINRLMNWTPGATPTAPTPGAYPGAPTPSAYPGQPSYSPMSTPSPTQMPFNTWMQQNGGAAPGQSSPFGGTGSQPAAPTPGGISGGSMSGNWQPTVAGIPGGSGGKKPVTLDPNVAPDASGYRWDSANGEWVDPGHGNTPYNPNIAAQEGGGVKLHAYGTQGTSADQFVAGDPQQGGGVNPELVRILNPGPHTTASVTPIQQRVNNLPHFAYGTALYSNQSLAGNQSYNSPYTRKQSLGGYAQPYQEQPDYDSTGGNNPWGENYGQTQQVTPSKPLTSPSTAPQYGMPQSYTPTQPMTAPSSAPQNGGVEFAPGRIVNQMANGVGTGAPPASTAPQVYIPSYNDSAYQNYPSLQYAQGRMGQPQYNTLATGYAQGAFGAQIPEAGNLNYGHMLDIMNDPDAWGALQSLYASGNRNLLSAVAAAKARAPFGQAVNTSLVRT